MLCEKDNCGYSQEDASARGRFFWAGFCFMVPMQLFGSIYISQAREDSFECSARGGQLWVLLGRCKGHEEEPQRLGSAFWSLFRDFGVFA